MWARLPNRPSTCTSTSPNPNSSPRSCSPSPISTSPGTGPSPISRGSGPSSPSPNPGPDSIPRTRLDRGFIESYCLIHGQRNIMICAHGDKIIIKRVMIHSLRPINIAVTSVPHDEHDVAVDEAESAERAQVHSAFSSNLSLRAVEFLDNDRHQELHSLIYQEPGVGDVSGSGLDQLWITVQTAHHLDARGGLRLTPYPHGSHFLPRDEPTNPEAGVFEAPHACPLPVPVVLEFTVRHLPDTQPVQRAGLQCLLIASRNDDLPTLRILNPASHVAHAFRYLSCHRRVVSPLPEATSAATSGPATPKCPCNSDLFCPASPSECVLTLMPVQSVNEGSAKAVHLPL